MMPWARLQKKCINNVEKNGSESRRAPSVGEECVWRGALKMSVDWCTFRDNLSKDCFFLVYFFSFSWDKLCGGSNLPKKKKKLSVVGHCELKWRGTAEKYKKTKIQHAQREGWSEKEWQDNKEKRGMSSRRHREDENKGERVRGEEQSGGGSVGGPIVMNRWWGEEKVKPVSVGVAGTHPVLCGQMCGALSLSPPLSSLLPGRCCQCPLACAQKLTHLFAFVLCYFWKRVKIASPSTENHVHVSQSR